MHLEPAIATFADRATVSGYTFEAIHHKQDYKSINEAF